MNIGRRIAIWTVVLSMPVVGLVVGLYVVAYADVRKAGMSVQGNPVISHDPEIGFVPTPNGQSKLTYFKSPAPDLVFDVFTDGRGARVSQPGEKSPEHVDILAIGCSFTWGHGIESPDTFPTKVGQELNVPVANVAFASFGGAQSLLMLRQNRDLKPKLVIYGVIGDHLRRNVTPCAKNVFPFCLDQAHVGFDSAGQPRLEGPYSNGVRRVQLQVKAQDFGLDPVTWIVHGIDAVFGQMTMAISDEREKDAARQDVAFEFVLKEMAATVEQMGAKLLVVFIPTYLAPPPPVIPRAAEALKLPFIDMTGALKQAQEAGTAVYIPTDGHPSPQGNTLIAQEIVRTIRRDRLLDH